MRCELVPQYKVIVSRCVADNLLAHMSFIANVSIDAAQRFISEYETVIKHLEENPFQYQIDVSFDNPNEYRRAVFAQWYKCIFMVEGSTVYIDSVVDCRQNPD